MVPGLASAQDMPAHADQPPPPAPPPPALAAEDPLTACQTRLQSLRQREQLQEQLIEKLKARIAELEGKVSGK
jgi:hypothetical protein